MRSSIRHHVDQLLIEQGRFSPIAWLLAAGYLGYDHYIDWRDGLIENLDSRFTVPRERIIEQLAIATNYARALGLRETRGVYLSTEQNELTVSRDPKDDLIFKTDFEPAQNRVQMDLFFDTAPIHTESELIRAIVVRNKRKIPELLDALHIYDSGRFDDYSRLIELEKKFRSPGLSLNDKLNLLDNELMPLAVTLLLNDANRFLTPLWQDLSSELANCTFDPAQPKLHLSYTGAKAFRWLDVANAIEREANVLEQPVLLFRHAEACFKLNRELTALKQWFLLFLLHTESAERLIKQTGYSLLAGDWHLFQELEPELPAHLFPAWILMNKPGLAKQDIALNGEAEGYHAYELTRRLIAETHGAAAIALRSELKQLHPDLFRHFLDSR